SRAFVAWLVNPSVLGVLCLLGCGACRGVMSARGDTEPAGTVFSGRNRGGPARPWVLGWANTRGTARGPVWSVLASGELFHELQERGVVEVAVALSVQGTHELGDLGTERHGDTGGACGVGDDAQRSEEHTSELQSRFDLVCRLLLE